MNIDLGKFKPTHPNNKSFQNYVIRHQIGTNSKFGSVYALSNGKDSTSYVLKIINTKYEEAYYGFKNEIKTGSLQSLLDIKPKRNRPSPYIYAYYQTQTHGYYIMDNVLFGKDENTYAIAPYGDFVDDRNILGEKVNKKLFNELIKTLLKFYITTGGYHGDLHQNNIQVVYKIDNIQNLKVYIIDYGTHQKFKHKTETCKNLECFLEKIHKQFMSNAKVGIINNYFINPGYGQLYISNIHHMRRFPGFLKKYPFLRKFLMQYKRLKPVYSY